MIADHVNQTSAPVPSSKSSLNAFHPFYDFHFGSIDCIAYGSACEARHVTSWPTFLLYKDGVVAKKYTGTKDLQGLSNFVEEILESIRPGSRPKDGVKLPEVGDESVDVNAKPDSPAAKDKDTAAGSAAGEKHNDIAQKEPGSSPDTEPTKADEPTETGKTEKPSRPSDNANPSGTSVRLAAESFQDLVTTTQDAWFIKFYAPWCPHCQMMAPNWEELGREMKGKLRVGEVNCDIESRLCKDVQVKAFPTIIYFKGGERIEYEGLRGLGDLVNFAQKALDVGEEVRYVDAAAFKKLEETEEVIFLYLYDHATTTEDFAAMDRVRLSLIGHAKLVKSNDAILSDRFKISTWPRLLVSRDGRPSYYQALAPRDMRDFRKVVGWMKSVWLPIVPELTGANAREIMDGRYVVLGILSRDRPNEFVGAKREIKNAALEWMDRETDAFRRERQELRDAKQLRIEEAEDRGDQRALRAAKTSRIDMEAAARKEVRFAWVDGVFWERWIRTTYGIAVSDGGRVIINDEEVYDLPPPSPPRGRGCKSPPLTWTLLESAVLGQHDLRGFHHAFSDLHSRDFTQGARVAAQDNGKVDHIKRCEGLYGNPEGHSQASLSQLGHPCRAAGRTSNLGPHQDQAGEGRNGFHERLWIWAWILQARRQGRLARGSRARWRWRRAEREGRLTCLVRFGGIGLIAFGSSLRSASWGNGAILGFVIGVIRSSI